MWPGRPTSPDTITMNAATQSLAATPSTVNEGSGLSVAVSHPQGAAGGAAAGTVETYTITGSAVALQQLTPSELSGTVTLDQCGNAVVPSITPRTCSTRGSPDFHHELNYGGAVRPDRHDQ